MVQLPRADFRGGVLQHLIFHGVHHRFGNDIIAGRKFQFQLLNGLVGGKRVLEVVVIVLVLPLGVCQLVADTVNGNCHVAGGGAVPEVIVHVEFQQQQIIDRLIECDRYREVRFAVHIILVVTNGGDLFVTVCRGSIGRGNLMNAVRLLGVECGILRQVCGIDYSIFQQCFQLIGITKSFQFLGSHDVGGGEADGIGKCVLVQQIRSILSDLPESVTGNGLLADQIFSPMRMPKTGFLDCTIMAAFRMPFSLWVCRK